MPDKIDDLRAEMIRILDVHLSDWEPDPLMWNQQAASLSDHLIECVQEIWPRRHIPNEALVMFLDGERWCCCRGNFVDLQESLAGFGETKEAAISDLWKKEDASYEKTQLKLMGKLQ